MAWDDVHRAIESLDADELEPDPLRSDWSAQRATLDLIAAELEIVFEQKDELIAEAAEASEEEQGHFVLAVAFARLSALLHAAGSKRPAVTALDRALQCAPEGAYRELLAEGRREPNAYVRLMRALWLKRKSRLAEAREIAVSLLAADDSGPIADAAREIVDAPEPVEEAPTLFSVNGFGLAMQGDRDHRPDGSYVTTRYVTALFIPLIPIDSFRVWFDGESYSIAGKVPLGSSARLWRRLLAAAVVVLGVGGGAYAWWQSPSRRLGAELAELRKSEPDAKDPGARQQLLERYETLIDDYLEEGVDGADLQPAAEGITRVAAADVAQPLGVADADAAIRVVRRFGALPEEIRGGAASHQLAERLIRWQDELGAKDERSLSAALRLLEHGVRALRGDTAKRMEERRTAVLRELADHTAKDWPLAAIRAYARLPEDPDVVGRSGALIEGLGDDASLLVEVAPAIELWASQASASDAERAQKVRSRLAAAQKREADPARKQLLSSEDPGELRAALAASPHDQALAVALCELERAQGDSKQARATLAALGPPGRLTWQAQIALSRVLSDLGELEQAESLLERVLAHDLPAYESASLDYSQAANALEEKLVARARTGELPAGVNAELESAPEAERQAIFNRWLGERMDEDPELSRLRDALTAAADVVPTAIALGTVKLRRATESTGEARARLLDSAERTFLSIRGDAEGVPSFHLGLGQVYHRLGKNEEGERELGALLAKGEPALSMAVARAYRELGLESRTRDVCKKVYERDGPPWKSDAAVLLSLISREREEREQWLRRADQTQDFVKTSLLDVEAERLVESGDLEQADGKYQDVYESYMKAAKSSSSAANNAALALGSRYDCTGDARHLDGAISLLDSARTLDPDSALVLGNTAPLLQHRAMLKVLASWLDTRALKLRFSDAKLIVDSMLDAEHKQKLESALELSPDARRAAELRRQQEVLAPRAVQPYADQREWFMRLEDDTGLRALHDRVKRVPSLDVAESVDYLREYVDGKHDLKLERAARERLARLQLVARSLDPKRDAASLAAVRLLEADAHEDLSIVAKDPVPAAEQCVKAMQQAHELWPAIGARDDVDGELVRLALLRLGARSPELAPDLRRQLREIGYDLVLFSWLESKSATATQALDALRKSPELVEAVALRKELAREHAVPFDWVLGRVAADAELTEIGARGFLPRHALSAEIQERLLPGERWKQQRAFLDSGKRAQSSASSR